MVAMATGDRAPAWPLPEVTPRRVYTHGGKAFGASRAAGKRNHAGVDILAPRYALVVAPESGTIVASQTFNGPNAYALLIQTDSGPVILLGEVEPDSWREFGLAIGSRVDKGQPVARVGINPGGSTMLHYEMYREGTKRNYSWPASSPAPAALLDPTAYLSTAAGSPIPGIEHDHDHAEDPGIEHPAETPPVVMPEIGPEVESLPPLEDPTFTPSLPPTKPPTLPPSSGIGVPPWVIILALLALTARRRK